MLPLASRFAALLVTAIGWCLMVTVPALVFIALPGSLFTPPGELALFQLIAQTTGLAGVSTMALCWLVLRLRPASLAVRQRFPGSEMAGKGVWIAPGEAVQAYALACASGGVVILSQAVLRLPDDEIHWLIEHERSHLMRGDAAASLWWVAGSRALTAAERLAHALFTLMQPLPLLSRLSFYYYRSSTKALRLAFWLFRIVDQHLGRAMEYRADRDAANATSPLAGARLLRRLDHALEPSFDLFASHPPTKRRIRRLEQLRKRREAGQ